MVLAGDFLGPSVLSGLDGGRSMVSTLNALGFTHVCMGNHEADGSLTDLVQRVSEFSGTWLNTNIEDFPKCGRIAPSSVVESACGTVKVGLLGLIGDEHGMFRDSTFKGLRIASVEDSVVSGARRLRAESGVEAVVPLTHQSLHRDISLAKVAASEGVPLIVGGHEHELMHKYVAGVQIVKTGYDAQHAAIMELRFSEVLGEQGNGNRSSRFVLDDVDVSYEALDMFAPEPGLDALVRRHTSLVEALHEEIFLDVGRAVDSRGTRLRQTSLGALVADACRAEFSAEIGAVNGASIKGKALYPEGQLTLGDLRQELPFPTKMVNVNLPGWVIQDALAHSRTHGPEGERRGFLQLSSGVEVVEGAGHAIRAVAGVTFAPSRVYSVALPRNLLAGFCDIEPLVAWAKANPGELPSTDAFVPAQQLVISHFAKVLWSQLGSFTDLDVDGSGTLDRAEVRAALRRHPKRNAPSELLLEHMFGALDFNSDGVVSREEWTAAGMPPSGGYNN